MKADLGREEPGLAAGVAGPDPWTDRRNTFGVVRPLFCLFMRRPNENQEEAEHGVAFPVTLPDAGSTPAVSTNLTNRRERNPGKPVVFVLWTDCQCPRCSRSSRLTTRASLAPAQNSESVGRVQNAVVSAKLTS
jgi:hypothetical protein